MVRVWSGESRDGASGEWAAGGWLLMPLDGDLPTDLGGASIALPGGLPAQLPCHTNGEREVWILVAPPGVGVDVYLPGPDKLCLESAREKRD